MNTNPNDIRRRMAARAAEAATYDLIPDGAYVAVASEGVPVTSQSGRDSLRVRFDLLDHDANHGTRGCVFAHLYPDPRPKLRARAQRMSDALGFPTLADAFLHDLAPGRVCRVIVEHWDTDDGRTFAKVAEAQFHPDLTAALASGTVSPVMSTTSTGHATADPHAVDVTAVAEAHTQKRQDTPEADGGDETPADPAFMKELAEAEGKTPPATYTLDDGTVVNARSAA